MRLLHVYLKIKGTPLLPRLTQ
ncbi:BgTH12-07463 [Blumeria graminis f. sp. triticale]|uniref:BgTH12-07463 n=1 Tax=Blumeria graminis f. sp. triticale TaxID=1689686 RepID=A0A9W4CWZ3_BLUGR|nr:BgTH12-07463 [Blumeria graminis f. sp. triticale]